MSIKPKINRDFNSGKLWVLRFDLQVQGQSAPKAIGILSKACCTPDRNLLILAWTSDKLSRAQDRNWHTHTHTHIHWQTQATTIPEDPNWSGIKMWICIVLQKIPCVKGWKESSTFPLIIKGCKPDSSPKWFMYTTWTLVIFGVAAALSFWSKWMTLFSSTWK